MNLDFEPAADAFVVSDPFAVMISVQGREVLGRRYDYVAELLEEGFEERYAELFASSRLHYEVINLIGLCTATMNSFQFPRRAANKALKKAVSTIINDYFKKHGGNA